MTRHDDLIRVRHMLDAVDDALRFSSGRSRAELDNDRQFALALLKCIEIVGEAAARSGEETRSKAPGVPWTDITGMRNRLVHVYFDIDLDLVWSTVQRDLPALRAELDQLTEK